MEMKIGVATIRQVFAPDYDWSVLYFGNRKIWEGHECNTEPNRAIAEVLGAKFYTYEFTDWEEIDGSTPVSFMHIKGIKELKDE